MTLAERNIMTKQFLNVLTPKGLRYVLAHSGDDHELRARVKQEMKKRGLEINENWPWREREHDGYEKE